MISDKRVRKTLFGIAEWKRLCKSQKFWWLPVRGSRLFEIIWMISHRTYFPLFPSLFFFSSAKNILIQILFPFPSLFFISSKRNLFIIILLFFSTTFAPHFPSNYLYLFFLLRYSSALQTNKCMDQIAELCRPFCLVYAICCKMYDVLIYALYPEIFCVENVYVKVAVNLKQLAILDEISQ